MRANKNPFLIKEGVSVSTNPRIRCQACASVLTNYNIRCAPMLGLPRLQGFSMKDDKIPKLKAVLGFCQQSAPFLVKEGVLLFLFFLVERFNQVLASFSEEGGIVRQAEFCEVCMFDLFFLFFHGIT
ncbi:hypothetical protein [Bacillus sp. NSP9.1]|uniref:hypothetical protein n=1 Tax=Bacillus sp. NSP9.1 TaxID=1071078 RepID=UPI001397BB7E|nr:hypothetical protein [Bacillus sp. NSP9.1]QHZ46454.1 hypothetical protein M654_009160 [Bacillus sp. NSP9.1]